MVNGLGACRQWSRQVPRPQVRRSSLETRDSGGRPESHRVNREEPSVMALKARVLLPAGVLAVAIAATACVPDTSPPPPGMTTTTTTTTTTAPPAPACPAAGTDGTPGPNGQNPIGSWGVNGTAFAVVAIGDIVYVGGTFSQAVSPSRAERRPGQPGRVLHRQRRAAQQLRRQHQRTGVGADDGRHQRLCRRQLHVGGRPTRHPSRQAPSDDRRRRPGLHPAGHPRRRLRARVPVRQREHLRRR